MVDYSAEINSISTAITAICVVIAAFIISIPKILTTCKKRNQLDLKIKHLSNLINLESTSSTPEVTSPQIRELKEVVVNVSKLSNKGVKRYSEPPIIDNSE